MKVIITAGGTGGHIYPALAIINKIKEMEPDSEFIYIGTHNRMEKDIIPKYGIKYVPIEIYGLSTSLKLMKRNIKNVFLIRKAYKKCISIMREFKPDIVIGVGGYVTYPVINAASKLGIKTFIHEQNSIPGKANRSMKNKVSLIGVSFKDSIKYFNSNNVVLTGNPCGENALKSKRISRTTLGMDKDIPAVLIFNGSLGSKTVNDKMIDYLKSVGKEKYQVLYITGNDYYEKFKKNKFSKNVFIVPYVENLGALMGDMDLIVSRAGASSMAEIMSLGLPSILIPSPYVANNHQYYNALSLVNDKCAYMIEEKDLTSDLLKSKIDEIMNSKEIQKDMKDNLKKIAISDSATIIYENIKKLIG